MNANVYIDGFNLHYSALRRRFPDCKWLDLRRLTQTLFPHDSIVRARYFSALIGRRDDDPQRASRQQAYLRALRASGVDVHLGQFRQDRRHLRRARPCPHADCMSGHIVEVLRTEEKGSDVNLASYLLRDAALRECELAIVLTNDTDLVEPIRMVRRDFGVATVLLSPVESPSTTLTRAADGVKSCGADRSAPPNCRSTCATRRARSTVRAGGDRALKR